MAEIAYNDNDNDNELSPGAAQRFYVNEPPISDVKQRGRPRTFANDEERLQYYKDNKYNLKYYHEI